MLTTAIRKVEIRLCVFWSRSQSLLSSLGQERRIRDLCDRFGFQRRRHERPVLTATAGYSRNQSSGGSGRGGQQFFGRPTPEDTLLVFTRDRFPTGPFREREEVYQRAKILHPS